nr:type IV secretory system conjugative DNA transfer family protein [Clostridium paraputrificum]
MKEKIRSFLEEKIFESKSEKIIHDMNDTDKSITTLKRLRFLVKPKVLNFIGIALFTIMILALNISLAVFDMAITRKFKLYHIIIPNFKFWILYVFMIVAFLFIYIKLRITIVASFETLEKGEKGNSRLTTLKEIIKQYIAIPERDGVFKGKGGVPISRYKDKIYIDISPLHTIVIGTTRSGKGQGFVLITIDIFSRAETKSSLVFNDPKGELCGLSKDLLERKGYEVKVIDFFEMENSIGYNPLQIIKDAWREGDFGEAELRCRTFTYSLYHNPKSTDKVWEELSMNLVNALILALCERCIKTEKEREGMTKDELEHWDKEEMKVNLFSVASMLGDLGGKELEEGTTIDIYFDNLPKESIAKRQYNNVKFAKGRTRASVFVTASQKLQVYLGERVAKLTSFNDINLEEVGFYKGDSKKVKVVISDENRPKDKKLRDTSDKEKKEEHKNKVTIHGTKDIICYKDDIFSKELVLNGITATGVKGQDLTDKIEVNDARVKWGVPGIYNMEYSVQDKENSKPIALFLIVPDFDKSNHVLSTTCISQLTYMLSRRAALGKSGSTDREVVFLLDEAGNMCPIENFGETLTVCLGRGLKFIPIVQSFTQLKEMYGDSYKTILANCANTVYIKTTDKETSEEISKLTGEKTIVTNSRTGSVLSFDKSITENLEQVPVIRYDDLIHMKEGETVVLRPMYRKDLEGNRITPYAIYNTEEMGMKFKYEYLNDVFSDNDSMRYIYVENSFNEITLEELKIDFESEMADLIAEKINSLIIEKAEKDMLYAEAKEKLEGQRKKNIKENATKEKEELKQSKLKLKNKNEAIDTLNMFLGNSKTDIFRNIDTKDEFNITLESLYSNNDIDLDVFETVKKIINE